MAWRWDIHFDRSVVDLTLRAQGVGLMTPDLVLYHYPDACSQVAMAAPEEVGLPYRIELVDLASGEQARPEYLELSPLGKVPMLVTDGRVLTENAAVISYIAALRPEAGLLPRSNDPFIQAEVISGLSFCSASLHPAVRGIAMPSRLTIGNESPVREKASELSGKAFTWVETRLAGKGWWLGEWSIIDIYIDWAFSLACNAGFDGTPYPELRAAHVRLGERPGYARMLRKNAELRNEIVARRS